MADDMDDETELLMVTGRSSKAAKKRRKPDSEDDEPATGSKRGKQAYDSDADGDDDMDEAERAKLAVMNELEREMYLYEREEQLQRARLGKAVLDQTREQVEVRASSRRPRAQTGTDSAIGKIAAAHAQREAREKKKQQDQERQEKQQRARSRKRATDDDQELALPDDEEEAAATDEDESASEGEQGSDDKGSDMEEDEEEEAREAGAAAGKVGARAETYDEGTGGYDEADEHATLEEILSIQLTRQKLEQWHNEPFFEADLPGCVLRIVPNLGPNAQRSQQPGYMLVRIDGVVSRNSYMFPKAPERTRKWLHLDDLTGLVFRHQMNMVSNSSITQEEYNKAKERAARSGAKFITKGDVQQALDKLQHARSFKYDQALVKEMLQKKRAAGKMAGGYAQTRARLNHELLLAQQEGRSEDEIQRVRDELDRLEQQQRARVEEEEELLAAAVEAEKAQSSLPHRVKPAMALALVNMRNRDKNAFKTINAAPGSAVAKAAAASLEGSNTADVFSRRHTVSKVYWATGRGKAAAEPTEDSQKQLLRRTSSSGAAAEVETLKGSLKKMDPTELIKVLDLSLDLSTLPRAQQDLVPRRVLGPRWHQTLERRQQEIVAGRHLISLQEWRQRCEQTRAM